jgi:hypothetical protein
VNKGDFFPLFWNAWRASFRKELVLKSFSATGIWPMDRDAVLKRFVTEAAENSPPSTPPIRDNNWRDMQRLVRSTVADPNAHDARELSSKVHHLQTRNELLNVENEGLKQALVVHKKHKKKGKQLDLQQRKEFHSRAVFWSPRKIREAKARELVKQQEETAKKLEKTREREKKLAAKLLREKNAEQKRVERES